MSLHFKTIGLWSAHTSPHASSSSKAWSLLPLALALPVAFIPYIMPTRRYKGWLVGAGGYSKSFQDFFEMVFFQRFGVGWGWFFQLFFFPNVVVVFCRFACSRWAKYMFVGRRKTRERGEEGI